MTIKKYTIITAISYCLLHYYKFVLFTVNNQQNFYLDDGEVKMLKNGDEKPKVPQSMIAEEAVDQLQASEKLIAGIQI